MGVTRTDLNLPEMPNISRTYDTEVKHGVSNALKDSGKAYSVVKTEMDKIQRESDEDEIQEEEMDEATTSSSSGQYSQPQIWAKDKKNWKAVADKNFPKWGGPGGKTVGHKNVVVKDYMSEEITPLDVEEATTASSSGQYSGPAIWAKGGKKGGNWKALSPNFPKYGGEGSTYVRVKDKCKKFPYCNQGDINALEFFEYDNVKTAIEEVAKKTSLNPNIIKKMVLKELKGSKFLEKMKEKAHERTKVYTKDDIGEELIRRGLYKSPVTDPKAGIVGVTPMNLPIGKIFTIKGSNKPPYES